MNMHFIDDDNNNKNFANKFSKRKLLSEVSDQDQIIAHDFFL